MALGDLDVGAHGKLGRQARPGRDGLGAPDRRADIALALRIVRLLLVEHDLLRDRAAGAVAGLVGAPGAVEGCTRSAIFGLVAGGAGFTAGWVLLLLRRLATMVVMVSRCQ